MIKRQERMVKWQWMRALTRFTIAIRGHSSIGSLMDGLSDIEEIPKYCKKIGMKGISISDHGSCAGHFKFAKSAKKSGMPFSLGIEFYIAIDPAPLKENRGYTHFVCCAKNDAGVKDIWKASSYANNPELFYYKPRINLRNWTNPKDNKEFFGLEHFLQNGNIIGIAGHIGSYLSDILMCDFAWPYEQREKAISAGYKYYKEAKNDYNFYRQFLRKDWLEAGCKTALELQELFKDNFYIELQDIFNIEDQRPMVVSKLIVECLREISEKTKVKSINSDDPHYIEKNDSELHRKIVAITLKETEESIKEKVDSEKDCFAFWGSNEFYIKSPEEIYKRYNINEINNGNSIIDDIHISDLSKQPYIPEYDIPQYNDIDKVLLTIANKQSRYMMYLAIEGAKKLKPWLKTKFTKKQYWDRLKEEFSIIDKFDLANYFLVVYDICLAADIRPIDHSFNFKNDKKDPIARGFGRGSGGSSLLCYFLNITQVDPLEYGLIFSRFFNTGRFSKGNISLPDLDLDFESDGREWLINYIKHKYGKENVAQVATYSKLKGRSIIKDLFRIKGISNGYEISNKICSLIGHEAEIIDDIQEMVNKGNDDYGIIQWSIDNIAELKPYYEEYKDLFDDAMRLEKTHRQRGKHPSGCVITPKPVEECFPMCLDTKTKEKIIEFEYNDAEKCGATKIDILGINYITKLKCCQNLVNNVK